MRSLVIKMLSMGYSLAQLSQGLLLHPYQTMQMMVRDRIFIWLTLLPSGVLAALVLSWRMAILPILEFLIDCQPNLPWLCQLTIFVAEWITFFCLYWQILLLYLFVRFWLIEKNRR